jgi:S1-C subfamily serine protease
LRGARLGPRNTVVPGDVILSVEGKEVRSAGELAATLDDYRIGQTLKVLIWREGQRVELRVTLRQGNEG